MDFNNLLNQVLGVAKEQLTKTANGNSTTDKVTKIGGGAAAIGILSMILGKRGGANLAKLGSLAALGSLAYQAYQNYQAKQNQAVENTNLFAVENSDDVSKVILQAMIAAAAADGAITSDEAEAIAAEAGNDPELQQWLQQEINQPATVAEIAQQVGRNQALASQVYLAARMVCKDLERKEIIFLANLAEALGLNEQFVEELEKQAGF
ncbi:tellurite resistance TerB family protein [Actinobacillus minor]|uniref:tellurite resistance TerB family protein n=1 Tax=Actinobacillus minor TaxID=51047 RepID=UPI0023F1C6E7|nr:DUF533 domain-containing protein [Actinobacillus minor]MDD6910463.1 DUF533 domain-containing protein [Actinobacillus minor]MDY4713853.1 DUF533 domain-containing protein [Actinobacillus minor]